MTEPIDLAAVLKELAGAPQPSVPLNWQSLAIAASFRPATVAELCGLSLRTVQRHFKSRYGITISDWLRAYRLQIAYERLRAGESIKSVAYGLGYKQLSHFSRDFKRAYGCAPRFLEPVETAPDSDQGTFLI